MDQPLNPSLLDLCACSHVDPIILRQAIDQGQDVNMQNHRGESPLLLVCQHVTENPLPVLFQLIEAGAHLHQRDLDGNSALHLAIAASSPIVPSLLQDPNLVRSVNNFMQTPLHYAAVYNNMLAINRLVRSIDVDQVDTEGYSPLLRSIESDIASLQTV